MTSVSHVSKRCPGCGAVYPLYKDVCVRCMVKLELKIGE